MTEIEKIELARYHGRSSMTFSTCCRNIAASWRGTFPRWTKRSPGP